MTTGTPVETARSVTPPVPAGTEPLQHQVAGHVFGRPNGQNRNKIGQLLTLSLFEECCSNLLPHLKLFI